MKIELRNHPAQARDKRTGEPLFYDDEQTQPVPLIVDQRAVYLNGRMVGYCGTEPGKPLTMVERQPEAVQIEINRFVTDTVGKPKFTASPPRQDLVNQAEREIDDPDEFDDEPDTDLEE